MGVRIGLAYNLKHQAAAIAGGDFEANFTTVGQIDAIERALRPLGQVIRLEADASFPQKLVDARPDFVFNIAEGLYGPNREGHVPAICEFYGIPCHASDPLTLGLALHKGRAKEVMVARGVPTAPFRIAESVAAAAACRSRRLSPTAGTPSSGIAKRSPMSRNMPGAGLRRGEGASAWSGQKYVASRRPGPRSSSNRAATAW